jgi:hypothetical protein
LQWLVQYEALVELYSRQTNSDIWTYQTFDNQADEIYFNHLDFTISGQTIYQAIELIIEGDENNINDYN